MACGLKEIGAQLEFEQFIKEITQLKREASSTSTEILTFSDSGSVQCQDCQANPKCIENYLRPRPKDLQGKVSNENMP